MKQQDSDRRVTIADISRIAGVSKATVSRVFNNTGRVGAKTRERVHQVIRESGYSPSSVARGLTTKRTMSVGLVIDDIANPFFMEIAKGIESVLNNKGYSLLLASSNWDKVREESAVNSLLSYPVDGLIIAPIAFDSAAVLRAQQAAKALVVINSDSTIPGITSVGTDNYLGGRLAVEHLLAVGCDSIAIIQDYDDQPALERIRGAKEQAKEIQESLQIRIFRGNRTPREAYELARSGDFFSQRPIGKLGIFALNDFLAMGVVKGLLVAGVTIPNDVSIVGFDDISQSRDFRIPLSTIHQSKYRMGTAAAEELISVLEDPEYVPTSVVLRPRLVVRATTAEDYNSAF